MKIKISNIGPIHEFEIDLSKKLTMIYGKNNIGKSYAISIVYMVLKAMPHFSSRGKLEVLLDYYFKQIDSDQFSSQIFSQVIVRFFQDGFERDFESYLRASYGNPSKIRNKYCSDQKSKVEIFSDTFHLFYEIEDEFRAEGSSASSGDRMHVFLDEEDTILLDKLSPKDIKDLTIQHLAEFITEVNFYTESLNYLPAVRSGIYLGYINFGSMISKLNQYQNQIKDQLFVLPSTTVPVSDFFTNLTEARLNRPSVHLLKIIDTLEKRLLRGTVQIDGDSGRIIHYSTELSESFDLSEVSSMVSELSIITAYIKFVIKDHAIIDLSKPEPEFIFGVRPLLFIEEPEAHLHPETQIKFMDALIDLANLGIHVIITSHSDYMLDCLGNKILGGEISSSEVASKLMVKSKKGSVVSKKMAAKPDGIEDHNFLRVTEKLFHKRIELNEKYDARVSRENKKS